MLEAAKIIGGMIIVFLVYWFFEDDEEKPEENPWGLIGGLGLFLLMTLPFAPFTLPMCIWALHKDKKAQEEDRQRRLEAYRYEPDVAYGSARFATAAEIENGTKGGTGR